MITIINYGSGNLRSIKNALTKVGGRVEITDDKRQIKKAETILLPGVGAFGKAMKNLKDYKSAIIRHVEDDKPFLGICLGLQLLLTKSEESPNIKGLNIIPGEVLRIPPLGKVPHMGWNQLNMTRNCPILEGAENEYFYFVHSYHAKPKKKGCDSSHNRLSHEHGCSFMERQHLRHTIPPRKKWESRLKNT